LINIHNELIRREMKTKIINQIHDSLIADCFPDEKEEFMLLSEQIATKKIREEWKWIIVPLVISWEETEVNGSWFTIRKVKR
jgi:DNA polymerase I-like protein with 3'-5' exonuclease and polymerase domains